MQLSRAPVIHRAICLLQGRSTRWPRVRREHLASEPRCAVCGGDKDLEVHHVVPFHVNKRLELEDANLITLCNFLRCHLLIGHLGSWQSWNVKVRDMAKAILVAVEKRPSESKREVGVPADTIYGSPTADDAELHAIRIRAKRVRYAAESAAAFCGEAAWRFARRVERLQTVLGEQHDAVVAEAALREQVDRAHALFAGELIVVEAARAAAAGRRWRRVWKQACVPRLRFWRKGAASSSE